MEYIKLGNSGLSISPINVRCAMFGEKGWVLDDETEIFSILKKCYDAALRTLDTADFYSNGFFEIL